MSAPSRLPPLERETLGRIIRGEDPWNGFGGAAGISGRYSRAINRLRDKGCIRQVWNDKGTSSEYVATESGQRLYTEER